MALFSFQHLGLLRPSNVPEFNLVEVAISFVGRRDNAQERV